MHWVCIHALALLCKKKIPLWLWTCGASQGVKQKKLDGVCSRINISVSAIVSTQRENVVIVS